MGRPPKPVGMTLNLAPMVDVLMCLIIFFLLASKMVAAEHYAVDLPWAITARNVEASDLGTRVTITVRRARGADDQAEYVVADWDGTRIVERVLAPGDVDALLQARAGRAVHEGQKLCCVVRADRLVMYKHVEVVLRGCGLAQIRDVVFSAMAGSEPKEPG